MDIHMHILHHITESPSVFFWCVSPAHLDKYAPESLSQRKNGWERLQQLFSGQLLQLCSLWFASLVWTLLALC